MRVSKSFFSLLALIMLTGCWDAVNIEERGFILGMAIDLAEEKDANGNYQLLLTNQFAVPSGLGTPSGGGGGKGFMNITESGYSIYSMAQDLANQTNKLPFFEHLKVIIISKEVASKPQLFANVMDVFIRNRDTRRGIKVIIAKEKAMDLLNIQPEIEKIPIRFIDRILENSLKKTGEMKPVRVGDIHEYLLNKSSFVLSEVSPNDTKINFDGGVVYKGDSSKVDGSLTLDEMLGYELIIGEKVRGPIEVNYNDKLTVYSIIASKSKIKIDAKEPENITINVTIELEGEMQETFGTVLLQKKGVIQEIEQLVIKKVEKLVKDTITKAQEELKADIFGFGDNLNKFHHHTWEKVKKIGIEERTPLVKLMLM
ncbi:Ger(x)C family spore germination protein [Ornithinibacillus halotolerans]|uniref:Germination protein GerLC n=1 Tax=Ornithinibacillus halotolerans TaxID=1274357 RepID=A0A916S0I7_9BACI|nr:Ger(x)C family spore germination protein [Ornithinibacillus halotolerans]GGA76048.1 germination protein GerLC [Ornithinibacillus halotolerans]